MRLVHPNIETDIEWSDTELVWEIVIESPELFREVIMGISADEPDEKGINVIDSGKELDLSSSLETVFNPYALNFNNRKSTNALLKIIQQAANGEEFYLETAEMRSRILGYLNDVVEYVNFDFRVEVSDPSIDVLAKSANIRIVSDDGDLRQIIVEYMSMMRELCGIKLFAFVHLRPFLSDDELQDFIEAIYNHQFNILLVESADRGALDRAKRIIIDKDLCEI